MRKDWLLTQVEQLEELQEELLTKERSKELSKVISSLSEEERHCSCAGCVSWQEALRRKANRIGHIPQILFHSKSIEELRRFLDAPIAGYEKQWEGLESSKEEVRTRVCVIILSKVTRPF